MIDSYRIVLKDAAIFAQNFSKEIIQKMVPLIQEMHVTPEQNIFYEGDLGDQAIYFIERGQVMLYFDATSHTQKENIKNMQLLVKYI